jgi:hypothetical protein
VCRFSGHSELSPGTLLQVLGRLDQNLARLQAGDSDAIRQRWEAAWLS